VDEKEIIKWGLIALGAYLIYEYIQQQGGLTNVLAGTSAAAGTCPAGYQMSTTGQCVAIPVTTTQPATTTTTTTQPTSTTQPATTTSAPPPPAQTSTLPMSQQLLNAATAAGEPNSLNLDQWAYYYQALTGTQLNIPTIPTSVYVGAGLSPNADGSGPDNTTPMPVSTWIAIVQLEMPQLGLSGFRGGMGTFAKYRPHWLN
jgi:hypothetical protein